MLKSQERMEDAVYIFDPDDFVPGSNLGQGEFGTVRSYHKKNPKDANSDLPDNVAIKEVEKGKYSSRELYTLSELSHPNIVKYFCNHDLTFSKIWIVMELCRGTLRDLFTSRAPIEHHQLYEISRVFGQLLCGVFYLHNRKIIHRDIKATNVLLTCSEDLSGNTPDNEIHWANLNTAKLTVKIGDFGLSRSFDSMRQKETTLTVAGTLEMMAPEIKEPYLNKLPEAKYTEKADVWSCGLLAYQAFKGSLPNLPCYSNESLAHDTSLEIGGFRNFLLRQLEKNATSRASAEELQQMIFIASFPPQKGDVVTAIRTNDLPYLERLVELYDYSTDQPESEPGNQTKHQQNILNMAASLGHLEQVKLLSRAFGKEWVDHARALVSAAADGHADIVSFLVREMGADVNVAGSDGVTALQIASDKKHTKVLEVLRG